MITTFSFLSYLSLHSLVFIPFLNVLIIYQSFALQYPLCRNDGISALLKFKESFVFDESSCDPLKDYTKLTSWKVGKDCCSWDGVVCDVETGHVIGLDLSSSCLYGSINSSSPLFRLVHLKSLDLSNNNFNLSTVPSTIKGLSKLKYLNLNFSNFAGQIPSEMLELSNLVSLDVSWNPLLLQKPSLKDIAETFTYLDKLHLMGVTISSSVPQSLSNLTSLSSLLLCSCSLFGEFPPGVFQLPNLRVLSLRFNSNLTGYLPEFDNVSSPLKELWLDGSNLSGQLPVSVGNLKSLEVFSAGECSFGGVIPSSVGNLTNLDTLHLSSNYFSGKIPSSLGNLLRLTTLDLDLNQLTGQIPSWLSNFTHLTQLSILSNELQGPIPEFIFRLPNLQLLNLASNNLTSSLKYDSFLQMKHISELQLSFNHLSIISSSYKNVTVPKFKLLGLGGCNLREFPAFLRWQTELEFLELSSNNIEGYVPDWLFTLGSLRVLDLANNSLSGFHQQPLGILSLPSLCILNLKSNQFKGSLPFPSLSILIYDVSHNQFSGHISPLFCNLTSALTLDLSSNNLSGTLAPCLGNVPSVLSLRNNSLSGEIPNKFASDCKLKVMDFSQNMFDGKLPHTLAKCSELEILNLDENQVKDSFPSWLAGLPRLRILSLRSNQFHGTIGKPLTKFEFSSLQIIDLSGNNFRGKLSLDYFRKWISMKNVDQDHLAYMQAYISFDIPGYSWTLDYSYSIRIVNKGTDRAYDRILESFVVVDLSSNKFEGEIAEIVGTLRALAQPL